jgi:hypothetical protein
MKSKIRLGPLVGGMLALLAAAQTARPSPGDSTTGKIPVFQSNVNLVSLYFNVEDEQGLRSRCASVHIAPSGYAGTPASQVCPRKRPNL